MFLKTMQDDLLSDDLKRCYSTKHSYTTECLLVIFHIYIIIVLRKDVFPRDFIPTSMILKGYFIWIKFGAAQTGRIFEVRGHCAAPD